MTPTDSAPFVRARDAATDQLEMRAVVEMTATGAGTNGPRGPRRFNMIAYTGGPMRITGFALPVIVDLAGLRDTEKPRPIYLNHDPDRLVGHTDRIASDGRQIVAAGVISGGSDAARDVVAANDQGFPWQASIGARVETSEAVAAGKTVAVNGRRFDGPLTVVRSSSLGEISFVPLGADQETSARIAAAYAGGLVGIVRTAPQITARSIEAALCLAAGIPESNVAAEASDQTMDAARKMRHIGIREAMVLCADLEGVPTSGHATRLGSDDIRAAMTTISLPGVLSNLANKSLAVAYSAVNAIADRISAAVDLKDFKPTARYRLTASGKLLPVPPGGEVKSGGMLESSWNITPATYGRRITLSRQMIVDDDMGAFLSIPKMLGRLAALTKEESLFSLILANAGGFFGSGNANYQEGSGTALSAASLAAATRAFREQKDAAGNMLLLRPSVLMVPPALEETALELQRNTTTAAEAGEPLSNQSRYTPAVAAHLGTASGIAGASDLAFYLLGNPADVAAFEIGYVDGQRMPVVTEGNPNLASMSVNFLCLYDFGVALADPHAAFKSKGQA